MERLLKRRSSSQSSYLALWTTFHNFYLFAFFSRKLCWGVWMFIKEKLLKRWSSFVPHPWLCGRLLLLFLTLCLERRTVEERLWSQRDTWRGGQVSSLHIWLHERLLVFFLSLCLERRTVEERLWSWRDSWTGSSFRSLSPALCMTVDVVLIFVLRTESCWEAPMVTKKHLKR